MNGGMERAQRLTQVRGEAATGLYISFYLLSFIFHLSAGTKGSGVLRHLAGSPGGGGGYSGPVIL